MKISSARLICFSPTGTTKKILEGIAEGIQAVKIECLDLTPPDAGVRKCAEMQDPLAIIGAPVYGGRLPIEMVSRFRQLNGNNTPAVIVVMYGNRAYEDALLELRDLVMEAGFIPVAAGAFIGEHSYSNNAAPIAVGRPDVEDLRIAIEFGKMVRGKITNMQTTAGMSSIQVPGNFPYKEIRMLTDISPVTQETMCVKCETCASVCPTAAIIVRDTVVTNPGACIRCCACVKACSSGARIMEDLRIRHVAEQLSMNCSQRKEPETYM